MSTDDHAITATVEFDYAAYGWEFRRRNSGSYPWEYRRAGGCHHDWQLLKFDHPLASFLRFMAPEDGEQP